MQSTISRPNDPSSAFSWDLNLITLRGEKDQYHRARTLFHNFPRMTFHHAALLASNNTDWRCERIWQWPICNASAVRDAAPSCARVVCTSKPSLEAVKVHFFHLVWVYSHWTVGSAALCQLRKYRMGGDHSKMAWKQYFNVSACSTNGSRIHFTLFCLKHVI